MSRHLTFAALLSAAIAAAAAAQQDTAVVVYQKVHPSVAFLKSLEGFGTGMVLQEDGLVLTNAHVVTSPLPYQMRVDVEKNGQRMAMIFKKVNIIGIHPKLDLALVQVDAAAAGVKLIPVTLSREQVIPGQSVYAIGNPGRGDGQALDKTITVGIVGGVNRIIEGVPYVQHSAPINPGNSGGPLVNAKGDVIGVNTLKGAQEGVGYAIPVDKFNKDVFVPLEKRERDEKKAKEIMEYAERVREALEEARKQVSPDDVRLHFLRMQLAYAYSQALANDPGNKHLYVEIGSLLSHLEEPLLASAYLARGIDLDPWYNQASYVNFGRSLSALGKKDMAALAYAEAIGKFPKDSDQTAIALAKHYFEKEKNYPEAAYYAKMAVAMDIIPRLQDELDVMYRKAVDELTDLDRKAVEKRVENIEQKVKQMQKDARAAKEASRRFLNAEFEQFVKSYDAMESEEGEKLVAGLWGEDDKTQVAEDPPQVADAGDSDTPSTTTTPNPPTPTVDPAKEIADALTEAKNLVRARQKEKAVEVLKALVKKYPAHADIDEAERLLAVWDKPKPTTPSTTDDADARAIRRKIDLAKLYKRSNNDALAVKTLQEVIDQYPDHKDAAAAKALLEQWKK